MTFGEKITKQRKELNYTQEQLADILQVSRQTISKWESDIAYPETDKIIKLSKIFNCSVEYLLKEETLTNINKTSCFANKTKEFFKILMKEENKAKIKKILKIIGIILAVIIAVDIVSMLVCFCVFGF